MQAREQRQFDVLTFEAGGQRYGLPTSSVVEIVQAVRIAPLPKAPAIVEGVIDVRGSIVPVLDIRARFRLQPKPLAHSDHLIIAWAGLRVVALRVDRALDLLTLAESQLEDAGLVLPEAEYVSGVAKLAEGLLLIHDLATFLSEAEAHELDENAALTGAS